eukprot:ANDGO_02706.mRNA.1 Alpha-tubulin N-acetyltransferase
MEIPQGALALFAEANGPAAVLTASMLSNLQRRSPGSLRDVERLIDTMGTLSSKAQGLPHVITSGSKMENTDHVLFLSFSEDRKLCTGLLKVGHKRLFIRDEVGKIHEINPLCVLDFYVHESCQRSGIGLTLFNMMLEEMSSRESAAPASSVAAGAGSSRNASSRSSASLVPAIPLDKQQPALTASRLAYDRPSPKLISFLARHFGLVSYVPQTNNFVVFKAYFDQTSVSSKENKFESVSQRPLTARHQVAKTPVINVPVKPHSMPSSVVGESSAKHLASEPMHKPVVSSFVDSRKVSGATATPASSVASHQTGATSIGPSTAARAVPPQAPPRPPFAQIHRDPITGRAIGVVSRDQLQSLRSSGLTS